MTDRILTLDLAGPEFAAAVDQLRRDGASATLTKDGVPVARVVPLQPAATGAEAAERWRRRPRLDPDDAERFARDVEEGRHMLPPPQDPWAG